MFITWNKTRYHVVACFPCLELAKSDPCHIVVKDFGNSGAQHAGEGFAPAGHIGSNHPTVFIGGRPQRSQHLLVGNPINILHTVSASVDV
ncbi:hypothetical protein ES703_85198 [subsurface metagenome]